MFWALLIGFVGVLLGYAGLQSGNPVSMLVLGSAGAVVVLADVLFMVYTKLYHRASASEAFVRTGQGGARVVLDGGMTVIPFLHQVVPVSLETMKLDVDRRGPEALITKDNLRVDVTGEFYIKVQPNRDDILAAARSLGNRSVNPGHVNELVFEKLVSALRSVAATMDLVELHTRREDFSKAVFSNVHEDLKHNGLTLESVTISRLDQTDPSSLSENNIFDAQGMKKITEITAAAKVERNRLERIAQEDMTAQDVQTRQKVLELERNRAEAEASQAAEVAKVRAARQREQQEYQIQQDLAVQEAEITKEQAVEQRRIAQEQAVKTAALERDKSLILKQQEQQQTDIAREQAVQSAGIAKTQAVEVAERDKEIAVAEREAQRARAEEEALKAQAERERAQQEVITVTAVAQAERDAQTKLIEAKQVIEQGKIKDQTAADVLAYQAVKEAEGEQEAAQRRAAAQLHLAEASAQAKQKEAEGDQALKMVDVEVDRERVNVEQARVDVERQALENAQTFDRAGIELEKAKLSIEAQKEVQIAFANSVAQFMSRGQFTVYGDPETMARMMERFNKGLSLGAFTDGFVDSMGDTAGAVAGALGGDVGQKLAQVIEQLAGKSGKPTDGEPQLPAAATVDAPVVPVTAAESTDA